MKLVSSIAVTFQMLTSIKHIPDIDKAILFLQKASPDLGAGCHTNAGFEQKERKLLLSVIVPAYNVEKYIVDCLNSILSQNVAFEYEVIIVNDGSTDSTPILISKYEQDNRVRIIHQDNQGLSAARNRGIDCSLGEYLCFVDSDDQLPENALSYLVTVALRDQAKLVVGSYEDWSYDGQMRRQHQAEALHLFGYAWGRIIHYSVFQNLRFPKGYWFEDSIMTQIIHPMYRNSTLVIKQVCYRYFINQEGISATACGKAKAIDSLWITMRLLEEQKLFGLTYDMESYAYFLSMVRLTYNRTKYLGVDIAKCIFVVQRMLIDRYYGGYRIEGDHKKQRIQEALRTNNFRKYVLACERNK